MIKKVALIDNQLKAYNKRDIKKFVAFYSPSVVIYDSLDGHVFLKGRKQLSARYAKFFASSPKLKCKILSRVVFGSYVVDNEYITGTDRGTLKCLVIYQIKNKLIHKVWMLRG